MEVRKYPNTGNMAVSRIKYSQEVYCNCAIGEEYYKGTLIVAMIPGEYIMDYIDEKNFINNYNNKTFSGEVLVNDYFNHLADEYHPHFLQVTLKAETSGHFPVEITKETSF